MELLLFKKLNIFYSTLSHKVCSVFTSIGQINEIENCSMEVREGEYSFFVVRSTSGYIPEK